MPKKKTAEIVRRLDGRAPVRQMPPAAAPASMPKKRLPDGSAPQKVVALVAGFENKVGRYELTRVDGDQAYYSFTNRLGRTADAIMSVTMWRRMQARADATYQETA
jgi:hypothetical protein